jgi:hypothetical protein
VKDELVLSCSCSHLGHSVRFTYFPAKPGEPTTFEAYVDVMLDYGSLWGRVKMAWRCLTQRVCGYGEAAEVLVQLDDLPKLRAWLERAEVEAAKMVQ